MLFISEIPVCNGVLGAHCRRGLLGSQTNSGQPLAGIRNCMYSEDIVTSLLLHDHLRDFEEGSLGPRSISQSYLVLSVVSFPSVVPSC
jgi:hypothetical protein